MLRSLLITGGVALAALTLTAGSCSAGLTVDQNKVEQAIQTNLGPKINGTIDKVACPGSLKGAVGEKMQCTMTVDGVDHKVDVTVASIEGTTVNFNMVVVE